MVVDLLIENFIKKWNRFNVKGAVMAKKFDKIVWNLFEKTVFEKKNASWTDETKSKTNERNKTVFLNQVNINLIIFAKNEAYMYNVLPVEKKTEV